jgi:hypothetical protein
MRIGFDFRFLIKRKERDMPPKKKRVVEDGGSEDAALASPSKKATKEKKEAGDEPAARVKKEETREMLTRDPITPIPFDEKEIGSLKIISFNVAGLRGILKNDSKVLDRLVENHSPDIICLQETKLQEGNVPEFQNLLEGYTSYWTCSTAKKGYSGTCCFVRSSAGSTTTTNSNGNGKGKGTISSFFSSGQKSEKAAPAAPPATSNKVKDLRVLNVKCKFIYSFFLQEFQYGDFIRFFYSTNPHFLSFLF